MSDPNLNYDFEIAPHWEYVDSEWRMCFKLTGNEQNYRFTPGEVVQQKNMGLASIENGNGYVMEADYYQWLMDNLGAPPPPPYLVENPEEEM